MISRLIKYHQFSHIINIKELETQISIFLSLLILIFLRLFNSYVNFIGFKDAIQSVIGVVIGGFITLTGLALSGVAIVTSLFSRIHIEIIEEDSPETIDGILISFEYLGFISTVSCIYLALLYIGMNVLIPINSFSFYIIAFITSYLILFVLFYAVALTGNCIKLYNIKLKADQIYELKGLLEEK